MAMATSVDEVAIVVLGRGYLESWQNLCFDMNGAAIAWLEDIMVVRVAMPVAWAC